MKSWRRLLKVCVCFILILSFAVPVYAGENQDKFRAYCDTAIAAIDNKMKDTQDAIERQVLTDQRKKVLALKDDFKETDNFDDKKAEVEEILERLNVIINGADTSGGDSEGATSAQAKAAQTQLGVSDEALQELLASWEAAKIDGWTEEALAGIYGNLYCESGFDPSIIEKGNSGRGIGMPQWTTDSEHKLAADWATKCGHPDEKKKLLKDVTICIDRGCQILLFLKEDIPHKYKEQVNDAVKQTKNHNTKVQALNMAGIRLVKEFYDTWEQLQKSTEVASAAVSVMCIPEQPKASFYVSTPTWPANRAMTISGVTKPAGQYYVEESTKRIEKSELCFTMMTGTDLKADPETSLSVAKERAAAGYWSEEELAAYAKVVELNVDSILDGALRNKLSQDELEGVATWERNVFEDIEQGGFIRFARVLVQIFGIMFTIWMIFLYIAYWFDRVNNFFYIDTLGILSFGYLHMSDTEEECTFHVRDLGKGGRRTVNHRAILFVCLCGIAFGVFIISGFYYEVLNAMVRFVLKVVGQF